MLPAQGLDPLARIPFERVAIDPSYSGDIKLVGDIDLDGTVDVLLAGMPAEGLAWYHYPSWWRTRIATPAIEFTTDGELGDLDGDSDLDVVVPDGPNGDNLLWFENPKRNRGAPDGNPFVGSQWRRHTIGAVGSWVKDVELADFDSDGRLDVAARRYDAAMIFFQTGAGSFSATSLTVNPWNLGNEGLGSGDVDGDGSVDLVGRGVWIENPRGANARSPSGWRVHVVDTNGVVDADFKAVVADLDGDGRADLLFSSSEGTADVAWFAAAGPDPRGAWNAHTIAPNLQRTHTLEAADFDRDGTLDVVVGQMHTTATRGIWVQRNTRGDGQSWIVQLLDDSSGIHNGVVADLGADGDQDLVGANWTGNPPLQCWENRSPSPMLRLSVEPLVAGGHALFRVTNATPQKLCIVFCSALPPGAPIWVTELRAALNLHAAIVTMWPTTRANRVADFWSPVPRGWRGANLWFQALEPGRNSNVVNVRVQ